MRNPLGQVARQEIVEVARKRLEIPSDKELAAKHGVSIAWVRTLLQVARRQLVRKIVVSRETTTHDNEEHSTT